MICFNLSFNRHAFMHICMSSRSQYRKYINTFHRQIVANTRKPTDIRCSRLAEYGQKHLADSQRIQSSCTSRL